MKKGLIFLLLLIIIFLGYWVVEPISLNPFKNVTPNYTISEFNLDSQVPTIYSKKFKGRADSILNYALDNHNFVGISVGIYKKGLGTWLGNAGYSHKQSQQRAANHTLYRTASIAKPMTAVAIMQLVEAGKLKLDVPMYGRSGGT